ncbi:MAG: efflux RND transporter periplasmic adaptor subunit [Piscinibacter sp.]|uniref:efflux RND transporter periplasmic adaptor subunit n=1 Tax=Piscinibacter sp. TaxID=1903157 RepID=UPI00258812E7|nr:efflux RND transporter periplasmic adaptor subunit [Piscinibacter sp.]MCW5664077.1 efflux RND transporter periplasmic adaptor subunit [Piscinibacter sp.]
MNARSNKTLVSAAAMLLVGLGAGWALSQWLSGAGPAGGAPSAAPGAASAPERRVLYWYDPMVPTQRFDKPGKSPFMEMQLVPRYADEAGPDAGTAVAVSPQAVQSLGLRVATAESRVLQPAVDVVGTVGLDERDVSIVQARANGFVERVHARAPGDVIAAGAPLADVLHPDWLAAQREYLAVRATGDAALAQAARARLTLLGMPASLVERVDASAQPQAVTTITAPSGGLIAELTVRRGMTVAAGMTLARINGLSTVWVEAAVPEALAAAVATGQRAELRLAAFPGEVLRGKVAAILPEASRDSRTLRVRVEVPNPAGRLRAGMFAQVRLLGAGQGKEQVSVPGEAVIRTGRRALVYVVEAAGRYRPVEVELGPEVDGRVAVLRGLAAGQQVVASGQFLIDSEASLQGLTTQAQSPSIAASGAAAGGPVQAAVAEFDTRGRVVDTDGASITLEHEAVPALKWPAMTMPFQLARPDLARGLKAGDAVRFRFRRQGDEHVVTTIEREAAAADPHAGHGASGASR